MAGSSISRKFTGTAGDDALSAIAVFALDEPFPAGGVVSYVSTLSGDSGNDTLTGWQGPTHWADFANTAASVILRSVLQGGQGDDLLISAKRPVAAVPGGSQDYRLSELLSGGAGNDTFQLRHLDVVVSDALDGGTDTVVITQDYMLHARVAGRSLISLGQMKNVENLTLQGTHAFDVNGSGLANKIIGNGAANRLQGGLGADSLYGGSGNDLLWGGGLDPAATGQNDRLYGGAGADHLWGEAGQDVLSGGSGDDFLFGGDGNDQLAGDGGDDSLTGGWGDDLYLIDSAADEVIEAAGQGYDRVRSAVINLNGGDCENVEVLELTGAAALDLAGGGQVIRLIGNSGRNTLTAGGMDGESLYGGGGDDVLLALTAFNRVELYGGAGNDRYYLYDPMLDRVTEAANHGFDVVETDSAALDASTGAGYGQNVEALRLLGAAALDLTGGGTVVQLEGNAGANRLTGGSNHERISGGAGNDILDGGAGDDTLSGGADTDELHGGAGNDLFVFDLIANGGMDYLDDFSAGDRLDFRAAAAGFGSISPQIGAGIAVYNTMTVQFYQIDIDGNSSVDLAFYARNVIGFSDLLAGFG